MTGLRGIAPLVAALALAGTGCTQVAALSPTAGTGIAETRFAANDVLLAQRVAVGTAPVCAAEGPDAVGCRGTTVDGEVIVVRSAATSPGGPAVMDVSVGARPVFHGPVLAVLDASGRSAP